MALGAAAGIALLVTLTAVVPLVWDTARPIPISALVPEPAADQTVAPTESEKASGVEPAIPGAAPSIDTVRVDPDGTALIAGRTEAGGLVRILIDDDTLVDVQADDQGQFAAFATLAPSDQPRRLTLVGDPDGVARPSEGFLVLAPTGGVGRDDVAVADAAQPDTTRDDDDGGPSDDSGDIVVADLRDGALSVATSEDASVEVGVGSSAPGEVIPSEPESSELTPADRAGADALDPAEPSGAPEVAVLSPDLGPGPETGTGVPPILSVDADGISVVQPALAAEATPDVLDSIALDAISYGDAGELRLTGRAAPGASVRIYLDNEAVLETGVEDAGTWDSDLAGVAPGLYTLRADQLDAEGIVTSRIEMPFKRESAEALAEDVGVEAAARGLALRTVQPGNTLWGISEERYGTGIAYVQVFEANADRIRNPDLIYPGQVFVLPDND